VSNYPANESRFDFILEIILFSGDVPVIVEIDGAALLASSL
jgi:hypothetical protein